MMVSRGQNIAIGVTINFTKWFGNELHACYLFSGEAASNFIYQNLFCQIFKDFLYCKESFLCE